MSTTAGPDRESVEAVVAGRRGSVLRVSVAGDGAEISIGAADGAWILRRTDVMPEGPGGGVARPPTLHWDLEAGTNARASWVTATGWSEALVQAICITVRSGAQWFEVTECLSSSEVREPLGVAGFQSQWHFAPGGVIGEVFTPNLIPIEGDLVGQHVLRSPVLVAESAGAGVVLAVDVDVLRKARVPAALSLLRASDDEVDLVVGLHRQEIRGHVFHQERGGASGLEVQTLWHCYHLGFFPKPEQGTSLAAARRKIGRSLGSDGASRPLDQAPEEYARQIYPRAIGGYLARDSPGRQAGGRHHHQSFVSRRRVVLVLVQPVAELLRPLSLRWRPGKRRLGGNGPSDPEPGLGGTFDRRLLAHCVRVR